MTLWPAAALLTGFAMDLAFGDPYGFPHIVRLMGKLIAAFEKRLYRFGGIGGALLALAVAAISFCVPLAVLLFCYRLLPPLGYVLESLLCWQLLAMKSLRLESMKVCDELLAGDIEGARAAVSMIVGRDTSVLDEAGIARAAVETVAENASDGVAAPIFYIMLGGGALGCLYKAVNTMDSMIGYKSERYIHFGKTAARLDDALNYIPSRLCALLMIASSYLLGLDGKSALRVWHRDRRNHASPNSAQTEAVCAGALGIRLAGPAVYFGEACDKPYIGDSARPVTPNDIDAANKLMILTGCLFLILATLFRFGVFTLAKI